MALLNNIYVFVESENVDRAVETVTHPTENGLPIESTIKNQPVAVSISGKIVEYKGKSADTIIDEIENLRKKGSLIQYKGNVNISSLQIESFNVSYSNETYGGAEFDMTLKEIRVAKPQYYMVVDTGTKRATSEFEVGDHVWFTGGYVYVSSDAKNPSAKRQECECKITIINTRAWSMHDYHLISVDEDDNRVYGWVDKEDIETLASTSTESTINCGLITAEMWRTDK